MENARHFPRDKNKFEFDNEVTAIFDDMAQRSIPLYETSRELVYPFVDSLLGDSARKDQPLRILDVGASTGAFYRGLWKRYDVPLDERIAYLHAYAMDCSEPMVEYMEKALPEVTVMHGDALDIGFGDETFEIVVAAYLEQFIRVPDKTTLFKEAHRVLKPGGVMILSGKEFMGDQYEQDFQNTYIEFRKNNGYTDEEIKAKTKALRNSMWTSSAKKIEAMASLAGFHDIQEVCRWLQFATYILEKSP